MQQTVINADNIRQLLEGFKECTKTGLTEHSDANDPMNHYYSGQDLIIKLTLDYLDCCSTYYVQDINLKRKK